MTVGDESVRRPSGRPRTFDADQAVADAAITFWEHGYEGTSITDLTAATGLSKQSLYGAFGSKADLYRRCLAWYQDEVMADAAHAYDSEPNATKAVAHLLQTLAGEFTRPGRPAGCMRSTAALRCADDHAAVSEHATALRLQTTQRLRAGLAKDPRRTESADGAQSMALFVNALIVGMSVAAQDGASKEELLRVADLAAATVNSDSSRAS